MIPDLGIHIVRRPPMPELVWVKLLHSQTTAAQLELPPEVLCCEAEQVVRHMISGSTVTPHHLANKLPTRCVEQHCVVEDAGLVGDQVLLVANDDGVKPELWAGSPDWFEDVFHLEP